MENHIVCCDWGTSSLRLRWVERSSAQILREVQSDQGIARIFKNRNHETPESEAVRVRQYMQALEPALESLAIPTGPNGEMTPLVISGMASSTLGMKELPYASVPFDLNGTDAVVDKLVIGDAPRRKILLISGLRTADDVMRGEEVQVIGMQDDVLVRTDRGKTLVILPGTHSKHVIVEGGRIMSFDTFFTGDLFDLLCREGLLKESVVFPEEDPVTEDWLHFLEGLSYSGQKNMLEALFKVRTNVLLRGIVPRNNFYFLSGLLIGYELRSIRRQNVSRVVVSCQRSLYAYYKTAADHLDLGCAIDFTPPGMVDQYTVRGQIRVLENYGFD